MLSRLALSVCVIFTGLFAAATAHAACKSSDRLHHPFSHCLEAKKWQTGNWFTRNTRFSAKNLCHDLGKMVVKFDISNGPDTTWTFPYGDTSTKAGAAGPGHDVRGIYCCTDVSDLCNTQDMITPQSCAARWAEGDADTHCTNETFERQKNSSNCSITATCSANGITRANQVNVHYHSVYKLTVCPNASLAYKWDGPRC